MLSVLFLRYLSDNYEIAAKKELGKDYPKVNGASTKWLYYALDWLNLNRFAIGQAQPGLSVTVLNHVPIAIPHEEAKQQRIADSLTSLDDLIAAQTQKLEALKTHKKGLMQQLFPFPDVSL